MLVIGCWFWWIGAFVLNLIFLLLSFDVSLVGFDLRLCLFVLFDGWFYSWFCCLI